MVLQKWTICIMMLKHEVLKFVTAQAHFISIIILGEFIPLTKTDMIRYRYGGTLSALKGYISLLYNRISQVLKRKRNGFYFF